MVTLLYAVDPERSPLITYFSMYARTNRYYNERGSRTNYVRSRIPHCIRINWAWLTNQARRIMYWTLLTSVIQITEKTRTQFFMYEVAITCER
jgi:hypothetical protein